MKRRNPMFRDEAATAAAGFADKRSYVRHGKEYRFGKDMEELRTFAFLRSEGFCQMPVHGVLSGICNRNISFETFELHHEPPLSRGGDDSLEGVLASCKRCHVARHGRVTRWTKNNQ